MRSTLQFCDRTLLRSPIAILKTAVSARWKKKTTSDSNLATPNPPEQTPHMGTAASADVPGLVRSVSAADTIQISELA